MRVAADRAECLCALKLTPFVLNKAAVCTLAAAMNRLLYIADNLRVMRGLESESVDLIATDPPYNAKRIFNAPLGSSAAKARFDDRWTWDEVAGEWSDVLGAEIPAIRELIEAIAAIEGGTVSHDTGAIDTGRVKNSLAALQRSSVGWRRV